MVPLGTYAKVHSSRRDVSRASSARVGCWERTLTGCLPWPYHGHCKNRDDPQQPVGRTCGHQPNFLLRCLPVKPSNGQNRLPHVLRDLPRLLQILLGVDLGNVGPGVPQSHLGRLDPVFVTNLRATVVPQLVRVPVRDYEAGLLRLRESVVYCVSV